MRLVLELDSAWFSARAPSCLLLLALLELLERIWVAAAPPRLMLTFVDGRETPVDLGKLSVKDTFAQIELETGRLDLEAMRRGKPWL